MDVEALLSPCSPEGACGEDLEYDPAFQEVESIGAAPAEGMLGPAHEQEVEWRAVRRKLEGLFARTIDLRVATRLARSALHTDGLAGFSSGLGLIVTMIEKYWAELHPRLDPDFDNNPLMRVNALRELTARPVLNEIQVTPLISMTALGSVCLKDILAGEAGDTEVQIDRIFEHCGLEALRGAVADAAQARAASEALEKAVNTRVAASFGITLEDLTQLLGRIERQLARRLSERPDAGSPEVGAETPAEAGNGSAAPPAASGGLGAIRSRDDVVRVLQTICAYYEHAEPSSPVPILLQRACRLVPMTFEEIVQDLAPSAIKEVSAVRGPVEN